MCAGLRLKQLPLAFLPDKIRRLAHPLEEGKVVLQFTKARQERRVALAGLEAGKPVTHPILGKAAPGPVLVGLVLANLCANVIDHL